MKVNSYLLRSSLVAALGGLLFGFDTAVIAGTTRALTATYGLSAAMLGVTVSMALWGTVIGSLLASGPSDRHGRKGCLAALGLLYSVSAIGCAWAWNWYALIIFRLVGGLAIGGSSVVGPMYIAEISPAEKRGRLVGFFQLNVVGGILLAYLSNYLVSQAGFGPSEWRWKLGVGALDRMPVFLAISIGMFNQLSGINAILYYLNDIFERAGFNRVSGDMQAVAIGFTNLVFTCAAMSIIDRFGRKKLLLTGAAGTGVCLSGVAGIFATGQHAGLLVWLLIGFIAFFAFSQGAVIWVYISEVFPNLVRAKGQSLGSFTHWIMNALISGVFPVMAARSGAIPFFFFAAMMALQFVIVLRMYPETKGVSLEQMEHHLATRTSRNQSATA